jgi:hypothetical protein
MAVSRPCYTTRERVARALDVKASARADAEIDHAIQAASDILDGGVDRVGGCLHRRFYPEARTQTFDWPDENRARSWRLWLNQHELISVTSITSGGTALTAGEYFLRPDDGPPFNRVEIDLADDGAFESGDTHQRAVSIVGLYGYADQRTAAGALDGGVNASAMAMTVTDSAAVGVGDVLLVDAERMLVTGRTMADTGVDIEVGDALTASTADVSLTVSSSSGGPSGGEVILVDSERMLVTDVAGTVLTVKRAWDGSVLATHAAGAGVYAPRALTVTRGALGSTAAAHDDAAAVERQVYPGLISQLATAEALNFLLQETSGYARTVGSGDAVREATGGGLGVIREQAYTAYGRKARKRAV